MDEYLLGVVKEHQNDKIIFECNNHGYLVTGVNLPTLPINNEIKLYVYWLARPGHEQYFAFLDSATKNYFLELISISYIGPKTALKILNEISVADFKTAVLNHNYQCFQKVRGVTRKLAQVIIDHFLTKMKLYTNNYEYEKKWNLVFDTLLKLGFGKNLINNYLEKINWTDELEVIINNAIKVLSNEYY